MLDRFPLVKIILSHSGGFLPFASLRFAELLAALQPAGLAVEGYLDRFRRFYFDTALSSGPAALPSLLAFARPGHVLFGSDFPYAPSSVGASFARKLDAYTALSDEERVAIDRGNAGPLFGT